MKVQVRIIAVLAGVLAMLQIPAQNLTVGAIDSQTQANSTYSHEVKAYLTLINEGPYAEYKAERVYDGNSAVGIADSNYFCWDICYGTEQDTSWGAVGLNTDDRNTDFYIGWHIRDNNATAQDSVQIVFRNTTNLNDTLLVTFNLSVSPTVAVREHQQQRVEVYPNPASSVLYVKGDLLTANEYRLVNLAGITVKRGPLTPNQATRLDVRNLPAGLYFLQVIGDGEILQADRVVLSR